MAEHGIPYLAAYGNITKALQGIQKAQTPERFTQDFLGTKLSLSGGSAKPIIPFLKKTGFLNSDGSPSDRYRQFRNSASAGVAAALALRQGFKALYEFNEYAHELPDDQLKGVVVQATDLDDDASTVRAIIGSFKALRDFADFEASSVQVPKIDEATTNNAPTDGHMSKLPNGINLGYTINLHLPATSDISVYNAIFKSIREHLVP